MRYFSPLSYQIVLYPSSYPFFIEPFLLMVLKSYSSFYLVYSTGHVHWFFKTSYIPVFIHVNHFSLITQGQMVFPFFFIYGQPFPTFLHLDKLLFDVPLDLVGMSRLFILTATARDGVDLILGYIVFCLWFGRDTFGYRSLLFDLDFFEPMLCSLGRCCNGNCLSNSLFSLDTHHFQNWWLLLGVVSNKRSFSLHYMDGWSWSLVTVRWRLAFDDLNPYDNLTFVPIQG